MSPPRPFAEIRDGRLLLRVRLTPKSSGDRIEGFATFGGEEALLVKVRAPPSEGEANAALIRCLADALGLPKSGISLLSGGKSRLKSLAFEAEAQRLAEAMGRLPARR